MGIKIRDDPELEEMDILWIMVFSTINLRTPNLLKNKEY